jgi:hypothetical protein
VSSERKELFRGKREKKVREWAREAGAELLVAMNFFMNAKLPLKILTICSLIRYNT